MIKPEWVHLKNKLLFIHYGGGIGGAPISMLQLVSLLDKFLDLEIITFSIKAFVIPIELIG